MKDQSLSSNTRRQILPYAGDQTSDDDERDNTQIDPTEAQNYSHKDLLDGLLDSVVEPEELKRFQKRVHIQEPI